MLLDTLDNGWVAPTNSFVGVPSQMNRHAQSEFVRATRVGMLFGDGWYDDGNLDQHPLDEVSQGNGPCRLDNLGFAGPVADPFRFE